jgi:serine/threonine-protein kinase
MLVGAPPFTGPTAQAVMARHSLDIVSPPSIVRSTISDAVEGAVLRALSKVPADRYPTTALFAEALNTPSAATGAYRRATLAPSRRLRASRWRVVAAAGLVIAGALGAWYGLRGRGGSGAGAFPGGLDPRRIAVLYFDDVSAKHDLGYLADGLTEALIADLTRVSGLQVISKNGIAPYRNPDISPDSVARALGVGTIVRGALEGMNDRYRVSVRLIDGSSGVDFRRGSFEVPKGSLLDVRDSLAGDVADFLRQRLGEEVRLREEETDTRSPEAWALAQQAEKARKDAQRPGADQRDAAAQYARADSLLASAERLDGTWLDPVVQRARVAYLRSRIEREPREADKWLQLALRDADRAVQREPQNPDALEIRGTVRYARFSRGLEPDAAAADRLLAAARVDLESATHLNPRQAGAWNVLSVLYYQTRDLVEANRAARSAYEGDAYLAAADAILWRLFVTSYDLELFLPAVDWCDKGHRRFPTDPAFVQCQLMLMTSKAADPDVGLAWRLADEVVRLTPERDRAATRLYQQVWVAFVLGRAGLADSARHVLDRSEGDPEVDPERELLGYIAAARVSLGDKDEALRLLERYLVAHPKHREGFRKNVHWWWRGLQDDPRFKRLIGAR